MCASGEGGWTWLWKKGGAGAWIWLWKKIRRKKKEVPSLGNTFLFVEPDDNYLNYGSSVLTMLVAANRRADQKITEIKGVNATPTNVKSTLVSLNPMFFTGIGHGNYTTYTVEAEAVFLQVGDANSALMKGRIVHLNSCETAAELGPALIDAGTSVFVGSNESFWFTTADAPNASRVVQSPFLAEFQFDVSLLQGKSPTDARIDMLAKYDSELAYWITGAGNRDPNASDVARILSINKGISTYLGAGPSTETVTLTVGTGGNGTVQINGISAIGTQTLTIGQTYSFTAVPNTNYVFDYWENVATASSTSNPYNLVANASMNGINIIAHFRQAGTPPTQVPGGAFVLTPEVAIPIAFATSAALLWAMFLR